MKTETESELTGAALEAEESIVKTVFLIKGEAGGLFRRPYRADDFQGWKIVEVGN